MVSQRCIDETTYFNQETRTCIPCERKAGKILFYSILIYSFVFYSILLYSGFVKGLKFTLIVDGAMMVGYTLTLLENAHPTLSMTGPLINAGHVPHVQLVYLN